MISCDEKVFKVHIPKQSPLRPKRLGLIHRSDFSLVLSRCMQDNKIQRRDQDGFSLQDGRKQDGWTTFTFSGLRKEALKLDTLMKRLAGGDTRRSCRSTEICTWCAGAGL